MGDVRVLPPLVATMANGSCPLLREVIYTKVKLGLALEDFRLEWNPCPRLRPRSDGPSQRDLPLSANVLQLPNCANRYDDHVVPELGSKHVSGI